MVVFFVLLIVSYEAVPFTLELAPLDGPIRLDI